MEHEILLAVTLHKSTESVKEDMRTKLEIRRCKFKEIMEHKILLVVTGYDR